MSIKINLKHTLKYISKEKASEHSVQMKNLEDINNASLENKKRLKKGRQIVRDASTFLLKEHRVDTNAE
jgi:hypothetical protein